MTNAPRIEPPDERQNRVFWLQHEHRSFDAPMEILEFHLHACYDVVAAPGWCMAMPRQPWGELWLIGEGQVDIVQDEKHATVRAGEIVLLTAGRSRLSTESHNAPLALQGFSFDAQLWRSVDLLALLDSPLRVAPQKAARQRVQESLTNVIEEARAARVLSTAAAKSWAQLALFEALRAAFGESEFEQRWKEKIPLTFSDEIARTLTFIAAHLDNPLDLDALARCAHLSPKHFARKFKTALGITPMEYVRRARIERAQNLLASSQAAVGQVAALCGFDDAAHFSRSFKEFTGISPLEFRRQARAFSTNIAHHDPNV